MVKVEGVLADALTQTQDARLGWDSRPQRLIDCPGTERPGTVALVHTRTATYKKIEDGS